MINLFKLLKSLNKHFAFKPSLRRGALDYIHPTRKSRYRRFMGVVFSGHSIKKPPLRGLSGGVVLNEGAEIILDVILFPERCEEIFRCDSELTPVNFFSAGVVI